LNIERLKIETLKIETLKIEILKVPASLLIIHYSLFIIHL